MSPTSREKAYARKRYEKWEQRQTVKQTTQQVRRRNALAAVSAIAGVALVVGGVLFFTRDAATTTDPTAATPSASAGATPSASVGATPSASADAKSPCDTPPAAPAKPLTFDKAPSPDDAKGKSFTVSVETSCGPLRLELDGTKAPQAVSSFVFLSKQGFFNNVPCHRLTTSGIFVLQCGDPTGTGGGGPGYQYGPIENAPKDGLYPAGTIAMARTDDPNSMGSQFFLVYKDSTLPTEGGGYTIMGKVTGGLDTLEKVAAGGVKAGGRPGDGQPNRAVSILSTSVEQG